MFTGIITDVGEVTRMEKRGDTRVTIATRLDMAGAGIGASICCAGCCLTVVEMGDGWFGADVSAETLSRTTLGTWSAGTRVNLERALRLGDELGGHIVTGHVDGVGRIVSIAPEGQSKRFRFAVPDTLARYIAEKGSVALDGTSFTVNEVSGNEFGVNVIPHTQSVTTWGHARQGDAVNVEIDMLARYVARLAQSG